MWANVAVSRGYLVCVYPGADEDNITAVGQLMAAYPEASWGLMLRRAWLGHRALDYVLSAFSDVVDGRRVSIAGHSRNAQQTMVSAVFDTRITAAVASNAGNGYIPYRFMDATSAG